MNPRTPTPEPGTLEPRTATAFLFWDIDGTLLFTGRAGIIAWEEATRDETGQTVDLTRVRTAGLTDYQIAERILESLGRVDPVEVAPLVRRYEAYLPDALPRRTGRVLDGVRDVLEVVRQLWPDVRSSLLTGNTRAGARAKLTYYDLAEYFVDGAFCESTGERAGIARQAVTLPGCDEALRAGRLFVIGDTPHDIACGRAVGARTVAVASGEFTVEELSRHDPWLALERLPDPVRFLDTLGLGRKVRGAGSPPA